MTGKKWSEGQGIILKMCFMDKKLNEDIAQHGGVTDKQDKNAGSGAFNQGSQQDEHLNEGVADGTPNPEKVSQEKENPKSGKQG